MSSSWNTVLSVVGPMEDARLAFLNAARVEFSPGGAPLSRMIGRPPATDTVWPRNRA